MDAVLLLPLAVGGLVDDSILVVEQHDAVRNALRDWLEARFLGHGVIEATSGAEAIALARRRSPGVILIDPRSLGANGLATVRRIKAAAPAAKIVVLAAQDHRRYRDDLALAGMSAYVPKWRIQEELQPALAALLNVDDQEREGYTALRQK